MSAVVQSIDVNKAEAEREQTDGFNLIIDALKRASAGRISNRATWSLPCCPTAPK